MYKYTKVTLDEIQRLAPLLGCKFAVLMLLRLYAGSNGVAYPSQKSLSDLSGYNARNIRAAIKKLIEAGEIVQVGYHNGLQRTAKYRVGSSSPIGSNDPKGEDQMILGGRIIESYRVGSNDPTIITKEDNKEEKEDNKPSDFSLSDSQSTQSTQSTFNPKKSRINWDTIKRL